MPLLPSPASVPLSLAFGKHWSDFCLYSFDFSRSSFKWSHRIRCLSLSGFYSLSACISDSSLWSHICGSFFFIAERKWKFLSHVWLFVTPWTIYSPWNSPGHNTGVGGRSLLQGIFLTQGSNPGLLHCRWMDPLPSEPPGKPKDTEVDSLSLLLRIFPTQESNWGILHCRQILY